jgi:hypothetical protein
VCALLGYYAASCGNCLPTFRDNVSVPSSRVKISSDIRFMERGVTTWYGPRCHFAAMWLSDTSLLLLWIRRRLNLGLVIDHLKRQSVTWIMYKGLVFTSQKPHQISIINSAKEVHKHYLILISEKIETLWMKYSFSLILNHFVYEVPRLINFKCEVPRRVSGNVELRIVIVHRHKNCSAVNSYTPNIKCRAYCDWA